MENLPNISAEMELLYENAQSTETTATSAEDTELLEHSEETPSSVPGIYNVDEESGTESEMSDAESPSAPGLDDEENQQPEDEVVSAEKKKRPKKRKKTDPTKRKKIRKLLSENKLNTETLEALKQEEERKKRLEEQAQRAAQTKLEVAKIILKQEPFENSNNMFSESLFMPDQAAMDGCFLAGLLTKSDPAKSAQRVHGSLPDQEKDTIPHPKQKDPADDVICISSDSEEDDKANKGDDSSDSSDDVICTGEVTEEDPEPEDVNNSGMHIEDAKNHRDDEGRVLVNVNRPSNEPEIFLAPQLAASVMPHQIGGIRFMFDNIVETLSHFETSAGFGCILAHSMGLGKTLQVISFVDVFLRYTTARTVLCVVPVNTLLNWVSEFNMWLPPKSKCLDENPAKVWPRAFPVHVLLDVHKTIESRSKIVTKWYDEGGVLLLGYEMYRLLTSRKPRKKRRTRKSPKTNEPLVVNLEEEDRLANLSIGMQSNLLKPGPDLIVCDEGHRIKNSHASISQMLKNVRTRRRIVLTGYPLQNNLMEYWCMVDFVRPNFLGTKQEFSNMFERPIQNGQCADSTESDVRLMRFRSHVLHSLLKGFVQRRSHSVLSDALPFKEEHVLMIRLSEWQKKLYNSFWEKKMTGSSGSWCSAVNPIKAFSVCCKIWNHPDVLYRTVREKNEENNDLDPDFDIPESLDSALSSSKAKSQQKATITRPDPYNAPTSVSNGNSPSPTVTPSNGVFKRSPSGTPVPPSMQTSFNQFVDEREKRLSYEWAKDLLTGYSTGILELSGKMVVLMQLIHASIAMGDRMLVFSQSLNTLTLIEEFLSQRFVPVRNPEESPRKWSKNESYFRLDGNTHTADRERMINQFNSPVNERVHLFLLSTRAGCLGINLVGANRVVVFDASWNPCHDAQAVCRVYRYRQQKTCHIYRLVCDQSMEKKIYERQVSKQGMSDRVVDKLNPTQVFTKQDVLSLMEYSNDELPRVNFENVEVDYADPILIDVCKMFGHWLTKKPFTHESLLLDCKNQRLTKAEKRAAEKSYERDKLASSTYNYGRNSYAGFYSNNNTNPRQTNPVKSPSSNFPPYSSFQSRDPSRPIANVRPMQSTSLPSGLPISSHGGQFAMPYLHKSGVSVQKVVASMDIPLPPQTNLTNTMAGMQPRKIFAGDTICIIRSKKGTYIRTSQGRTFAVRLNDSGPRFTGPQNQLVTQLTSSASAPQLHPPQSPSQIFGPQSTGQDDQMTSSQAAHSIPTMQTIADDITSSGIFPGEAPPPAHTPTFSLGPPTSSWNDLGSTNEAIQSVVSTSSLANDSSLMSDNGNSYDVLYQSQDPYMPMYSSQSPMVPLHRPPATYSNGVMNSFSQPSLIGSNPSQAQFYGESTNEGDFPSMMHLSRSSGSMDFNLTANQNSTAQNGYQAPPLFSTNQDFALNQNSMIPDQAAMRTNYSFPTMAAANPMAMDLSNQTSSQPMDLTGSYKAPETGLGDPYPTTEISSQESALQTNDIDLDLPLLDW